MGASLLSFWYPVGQAEANVAYPVDLERFLAGKRCKRQVLYAYCGESGRLRIVLFLRMRFFYTKVKDFFCFFVFCFFFYR